MLITSINSLKHYQQNTENNMYRGVVVFVNCSTIPMDASSSLQFHLKPLIAAMSFKTALFVVHSHDTIDTLRGVE